MSVCLIPFFLHRGRWSVYLGYSTYLIDRPLMKVGCVLIPEIDIYAII